MNGLQGSMIHVRKFDGVKENEAPLRLSGTYRDEKKLLVSRKVKAVPEEFAGEPTLGKPIRFQQLSREQLVKYDSCDTSCCLASCVAQSFDLMLRVWKMAGSQLGGEFSEDCPSVPWAVLISARVVSWSFRFWCSLCQPLLFCGRRRR